MLLLDTATIEENGATSIVTAAWEGDVLVIKANADAGGTIITFSKGWLLTMNAVAE
jgi:hypothetical protein